MSECGNADTMTETFGCDGWTLEVWMRTATLHALVIFLVSCSGSGSGDLGGGGGRGDESSEGGDREGGRGGSATTAVVYTIGN